MGVDAANKEAEGLRLVATHELTNTIGSGNRRMGHRAAHSKTWNLLEREHFQLLYGMVLACSPNPITEVGHIMHHTSEAASHGLVIAERTVMLRIQARIEGSSDWDAHCHRAEVVGKQHALLGQTVNVGSLQVFAPIASNLVSPQIVGYEHQNIGMRRGLPCICSRADQARYPYQFACFHLIAIFLPFTM